MKNEQVYTLRLWQDEITEEWHASLKNMKSKEVQYFHGLDTFVSYLVHEVLIAKEKGGTQ